MPNTVSSGSGTAEILDVRAQFVAVERPRHHRAAALRAAGRFGVVIRKGQRHVEAQQRSCVVKKSTASGPAVRNASTRAASKLLPASWRR